MYAWRYVYTSAGYVIHGHPDEPMLLDAYALQEVQKQFLAIQLNIFPELKITLKDQSIHAKYAC